MITRTLICITACALLGSCASSLPRYPNDKPKNVTINLHFDGGGGFLSSSEAYAGINDFTKDCSTKYQGWVKLAEGKNEVGLPIGKPTLLVVELSESSLGGNGHSMQRGVVIMPKSGVHYEVDANYADTMYDIRFYRMTRTGKRRLNIHTAPPGCHAKK
jgi:hypothetical protein